MSNKLKTKLAFSTLMAMTGGLGHLNKSFDQNRKKCLLSSCEVLTSHRGGYCCAEHCEEHRQIQKNANS